MTEKERQLIISFLKEVIEYLEAEDVNLKLKEPEKSVNTEQLVTDYIQGLGIPAHIAGYGYIRKAVMLALEDQKVMNSLTKEWYPKVASEYQTTPSRVERAIGHAIEISWFKGNVEMYRKILGYSRDDRQKKPTNGVFLTATVPRPGPLSTGPR